MGEGACHAADEYQSIALMCGALKNSDPVAATVAARQAVMAIERRLDLNPDDLRALSLGSGTLVSVGRVEEGLAMAERALELAPDELGTLYNGACSFARAGRHDRALELLEHRLEMAGTIYREWVEHDSDFDGMRGDPRFIALLDRMPRVGA